MIHADRQTDKEVAGEADRYDEANRRLSLFTRTHLTVGSYQRGGIYVPKYVCGMRAGAVV
jgi:hypothetical protein